MSNLNIEETKALPFYSNAKIGTTKTHQGFVPLLRDGEGREIDRGPPCETRSKARNAAWSEWRRRCNAHNNSRFFGDYDQGW